MKYLKMYEKYLELDDIKNKILLEAIGTDNLDIINFFVNKGYDINGDDVLLSSSYNYDLFRYFLSKGSNVKEAFNDYRFKNNARNNIEIQKALIDYGYEVLVHDTVGFDSRLKKDSKYADIIKRFEDINKYNL